MLRSRFEKFSWVPTGLRRSWLSKTSLRVAKGNLSTGACRNCVNHRMRHGRIIRVGIESSHSFIATKLSRRALCAAAADDAAAAGEEAAGYDDEDGGDDYKVPEVTAEHFEEAEERALGLWYEGQWENAESDGVPYRYARPHLEPIADLKLRYLPELREDKEFMKHGAALVDIIEHQAYCYRFGDADSGGAFHDMSIADFDEYSNEDSFYNEQLTEDNLNTPEDYEQEPYVPAGIRQQIYFLWAYKNWGADRLGKRFRLAPERVSAIIALKRLEPEYIARGLHAPHLEQLFSDLYGAEYMERLKPGSWGRPGQSTRHSAGHSMSNSEYAAEAAAAEERGEGPLGGYEADMGWGLEAALLTDAQLPDDYVPKLRHRGNAIRMGARLPQGHVPPRKERGQHASRFAFKDISAGDTGYRGAHQHHVVVDWDGTRRRATQREEIARSYRPRRHLVQRNGAVGVFFGQFEESNPALQRVADREQERVRKALGLSKHDLV